MRHYIESICISCGNKILAYGQRKFCNKFCESVGNVGSNNPNYRNKWTEEQKETQRQLVKSKVDDEYRKKCAKANKGKKFDENRRKRMSLGKQKWYFENSPVPMSEETKKKIGLKSAAKFTEEYKKKHRNTWEKLGYWIPLEQKTDKQIYYMLSDWTERMFDRIFCTQQLKLLNECGVFHSIKNKNGVVRDHIYSRRSGLENGVFPEILRHPVNCQLLTNVDNSKKRRGINRTGDGIELTELFRRIKEYDIDWPEQDLCLSLIKEYENGKRWSRKNGKQKGG